MSVTIHAEYQGQKRIKLTHDYSGAQIVTDAPLDNEGLAQSFSPTDLISSGLGACMLTVMGIVADRKGYSLAGAHARIEKEMSTSPRRIGKISIELHLPEALDSEARTVLERAAGRSQTHDRNSL